MAVGLVGYGCITRGVRQYISLILTITAFGLTLFYYVFLEARYNNREGNSGEPNRRYVRSLYSQRLLSRGK